MARAVAVRVCSSAPSSKRTALLSFFILTFDFMIQAEINYSILLLGLVSLIAANWPFFRAKGPLSVWRVAIELMAGFFLTLLLARFLESRYYSVFPQSPLFYGIIALLFLSLTFFGIIYRMVMHKKNDSDSSNDLHLIEKEISSQSLPVGKHFHWIHSEVMLPNGQTASREYLNHPGAVMILPVLDNGDIVFERQYRHPGKQVFLELPAGKLHKGEDPLLCGQRELEEETGYRAEQWQYLGQVCPAIGYSDEIIEIFLAKKLTFTAQQLDEGEFIETVTFSLDEAVNKVLGGEIIDAKTITGVFWLSRLLKK